MIPDIIKLFVLNGCFINRVFSKRRLLYNILALSYRYLLEVSRDSVVKFNARELGVILIINPSIISFACRLSPH